MLGFVGMLLPMAVVARGFALLRWDITALRRWSFACTARLLGVKIIVRGEQSAASPQLVVANHISYFDIFVLGGAARGTFVAKSDIRSWPVLGWMAQAAQTVFVDRRRTAAGEARDELCEHLEAGTTLFMFPESTSNDGNRIRPFKSALFHAAESVTYAGNPVVVQPVSIAYTRLNGMPLGIGWRPFFAWYGDMDLVPHLWMALRLGTLTAEVTFHAPVSAANFRNRKQLAKHCEEVTGAGVARLLMGREAA